MAKRAPATRRQRGNSDTGKPRGRTNVGVMTAATDVMGRTWSGIEDVSREVGVTAIAAVRGTMHTAEQIGGDLLAAARAAVEGTLEAAERIGGATNQAVKHIVSAEKTRRQKPVSPSRSNR
jgi:hypothetical protein